MYLQSCCLLVVGAQLEILLQLLTMKFFAGVFSDFVDSLSIFLGLNE